MARHQKSRLDQLTHARTHAHAGRQEQPGPIKLVVGGREMGAKGSLISQPMEHNRTRGFGH